MSMTHKEIEIYAEKNADAPMKCYLGEGAFSPRPVASFIRPKMSKTVTAARFLPQEVQILYPHPACSFSPCTGREGMFKPRPGLLLSASIV